MALSTSNEKRISEGNKLGIILDIKFDTNYPTGGEILDLGKLGFNTVDYCTPAFSFSMVGLYFIYPDIALDGSQMRLAVYQSSPTKITQVPPGTDLSSVGCTIKLTGN